MVKDVNHVKRILSGVMLLLAIAIVTAAVVIYVTQSTSVLLHLALPVMFLRYGSGAFHQI